MKRCPGNTTTRPSDHIAWPQTYFFKNAIDSDAIVRTPLRSAKLLPRVLYRISGRKEGKR